MLSRQARNWYLPRIKCANGMRGVIQTRPSSLMFFLFFSHEGGGGGVREVVQTMVVTFHHLHHQVEEWWWWEEHQHWRWCNVVVTAKANSCEWHRYSPLLLAGWSMDSRRQRSDIWGGGGCSLIVIVLFFHEGSVRTASYLFGQRDSNRHVFESVISFWSVSNCTFDGPLNVWFGGVVCKGTPFLFVRASPELCHPYPRQFWIAVPRVATLFEFATFMS